MIFFPKKFQISIYFSTLTAPAPPFTHNEVVIAHGFRPCSVRYSAWATAYVVQRGEERVLPGCPSTLMEQSENKKVQTRCPSTLPVARPASALPFHLPNIAFVRKSFTLRQKQKSILSQNDWFETTSLLLSVTLKGSRKLL